MSKPIENRLFVPSPLERINFRFKDKIGDLYIKRDDLIHFIIGGNKCRKLMGHPVFRKPTETHSVLSTGGNYSNLVFALSWMCHFKGYPLTILSPETKNETYLMTWARKLGVRFKGVSRSELRKIREGSQCPMDVVPELNEVVWIPEGGGGSWSEYGIRLLIDELKSDFDKRQLILLIAAGTGITGFQMASNLPEGWDLSIFPAIKSKAFNSFLIQGFATSIPKGVDISLIPQIGDKGIGSTSDELLDFLMEFYHQSGILLDPFYNGKALYYFWKSDGFKKTDKEVVLIHSGGTQAWYGLSLAFPSDRRVQFLSGLFSDEFKKVSETIF